MFKVVEELGRCVLEGCQIQLLSLLDWQHWIDVDCTLEIAELQSALIVQEVLGLDIAMADVLLLECLQQK